MIPLLKKIGTVVKGWWLTFAHALGWFNTRLLLTIVYIFVIGLPAAAFKIFRKDLLDRKLRDRKSYWVPKEKISHTLEHSKYQF